MPPTTIEDPGCERFLTTVFVVVQVFTELDRLNVRLFGENMFGIHSIDYEGIDHVFYVFGMHGVFPPVREAPSAKELQAAATHAEFVAAVRRALLSLEGDDAQVEGTDASAEQPVWFDWYTTVGLAACLDLPVVPVVWLGEAASVSFLQRLMHEAATMPSAAQALAGDDNEACRNVITPEGFVVRHTCAFPNDSFDSHIAKYVRAGHNQTEADWMRTWKRAKVSNVHSRRGRLVKLAALLADSTANRSTDSWHWFVTNARVRAAVRAFLTHLAGQYSHNITTDRGVCTHELISTQTAGSPTASESDAAVQDEHTVRKFPRTPHLFHSRGATSDDIVLSSGEVDKFLRTEVIVQEKVDGANLGFSLTADYQVRNDDHLHICCHRTLTATVLRTCTTAQLRIQNRSHFINEQTSEQFQRTCAGVCDDRGRDQTRSDVFDMVVE